MRRQEDLYWSKRGEIACGVHAPREGDTRWIQRSGRLWNARATVSPVSASIATADRSPIRTVAGARRTLLGEVKQSLSDRAERPRSLDDD
jgi:ribonuclease PH